MKKVVFILMFLTIGFLNESIAAENEVKKQSALENKIEQQTVNKTEEANLIASLCGYDVMVYRQCSDGSLEPAASIHIVYWCETGKVNVNMSWVTTVSPSVECTSLFI